MKKYILTIFVIIGYCLLGFGSLEARTIHAPDATIISASAIENQLGFNSSYHDEESDLVYKRARYYSTEQGRFISRDPLGYVDGMGLYAGYFASMFGLDPSGMQCLMFCKCEYECLLYYKSLDDLKILKVKLAAAWKTRDAARQAVDAGLATALGKTNYGNLDTLRAKRQAQSNIASAKARNIKKSNPNTYMVRGYQDALNAQMALATAVSGLMDDMQIIKNTIEASPAIKALNKSLDAAHNIWWPLNIQRMDLEGVVAKTKKDFEDCMKKAIPQAPR